MDALLIDPPTGSSISFSMSSLCLSSSNFLLFLWLRLDDAGVGSLILKSWLSIPRDVKHKKATANILLIGDCKMRCTRDSFRNQLKRDLGAPCKAGDFYWDADGFAEVLLETKALLITVDTSIPSKDTSHGILATNGRMM